MNVPNTVYILRLDVHICTEQYVVYVQYFVLANCIVKPGCNMLRVGKYALGSYIDAYCLVLCLHTILHADLH
jgi:hypothetical protein